MNTPPPISPVALTPTTLTLAKERTYFALVLVFSILVWVVLVVTIFGLIYAAIFAVVFWLANGLMVARLRSEAVKVDERQMPELHAAFREICTRLGMARPPALYLVQAGGALNAFAARHAGRDFVVVFSDFLEALGAESPELKFVLGPAYRRSWESSCDRYGAFAAGEVDGAVRAVLTLSGGREGGRHLDAQVFARQNREERGFFVSLHELLSTYPTLSRRVTDLLALKTGQPAARPVCNPIAYFLALFVPGGNTAAPANALIFIVILGLLAAMAIPAFQKVHQTAEAHACLSNLRQLSAACDQYAVENGKAPADLHELTGAGKLLDRLPLCPAGGEYRLASGGTEGVTRVFCTIHGGMEDLQRQLQRRP